jgi:hypothetical protein
MKKDIFFSEVTPLNFRANESKFIPIIPIISIFQVVVAASSTILLPYVEYSCNESPLYFWLTGMILIHNCHLILTALENFMIRFGYCKGLWVLHTIMVLLIESWSGLGHYLTLYKGLSCIGGQDFTSCCVLLGMMDLLTILLIGITVNNFFSPDRGKAT